MQFKVRLVNRQTGEVTFVSIDSPDRVAALSSFDKEQFIATMEQEPMPLAGESQEGAIPDWAGGDEGLSRAKVMVGVFVAFLGVLVLIFIVGSSSPDVAPFIVIGAMVGGFGLAVLYFLAKIANKS